MLRIHKAAALLAIVGLAACSGVPGSNSIPAQVQSDAVSVRLPMYAAVPHAKDESVSFAATGTQSGTVDASYAAKGPSGATVSARAFDTHGNELANVQGVVSGNTISLQMTDDLGAHAFPVLNPSSIHAGDNALPGGGNLHIDAQTGIATAIVTSPNGTIYHIMATPNYDDTATLEIDGSDGSAITQRLAGPGGTSTNAKAAVLHAMDACQTAKNFAGYSAAVAGVAGGVAFVGGLTGAAPVAVVAGGVAAGMAALGGATWLVAWASGCQM